MEDFILPGVLVALVLVAISFAIGQQYERSNWERRAVAEGHARFVKGDGDCPKWEWLSRGDSLETANGR